MTLPYYYTTTIRARLSASQIQQALITNSTDGMKSLMKQRKATYSDWQQGPGAEEKAWRKYRRVYLMDAATGAPLFPKCYLKMEELGAYRLVELKFRPVLFISIFMAIWSSGVLLATYQFVKLAFETGKPADRLGLLALVPFHLGFWLFHKLIFQDGVRESVALLKKILQAD